MSSEELLNLVSGGESSRVQFKENITNAVSAAQEMVAFSNAKGGILLIGVNDKTGNISGLSFDDLQRIRACQGFHDRARASKFYFRQGKICSRMRAIMKSYTCSKFLLGIKTSHSPWRGNPYNF